MRRPDFHLRRYQLWQMAGDGLLIAVAWFLAFQLRFLDAPGTIPSRYLDVFFGSLAFVVLGKIVIFYLFGLYQKWWRFVGGRDIMRIVQAVTISSLLLIVIFAVAQPFQDSLPRSVAMTDYLLTMMLIAGARLATRLFKERPGRGSRIARGREVLVIGAGSGGQMVVRELRLNPALGETAIGFVDDNNGMRGMRIEGISVLGNTDEIETILDETEPDQVVIAIPSAPGTLRGKVVAACRDRQIPVRTLPTVFELLRGGVQLSQQLREVQVEDVLGREPVVVELERGRRIPRGPGCAGHRCRRLDRLGALPPDRPGEPPPAGHARSRRGQPLPDRARNDRRASLQPGRGGACRLQGGRAHV